MYKSKLNKPVSFERQKNYIRAYEDVTPQILDRIIAKYNKDIGYIN